MSDASSVVTYTSVYMDSEPWRYYGEDSAETGPPRVIVYGYDGLLIHPVASPSPDYIPYVPEPEYPKYLEPSDDEAPLEDQPLPAEASLIAASPDYVADSDPKEDPEDDQADYPADGGDGDDEPSEDDDDDDTDDEDPEKEPFKDEEDDEEEEEH
uniref:Uncharacterized protein n=1 Tax=Tanacetum cinerariifolium TaxID=118510 RepID=A0A699J7H1_TANCI|nr:hypothetical protein [Tanacetum cinerariifolium]